MFTVCWTTDPEGPKDEFPTKQEAIAAISGAIAFHNVTTTADDFKDIDIANIDDAKRAHAIRTYVTHLWTQQSKLLALTPEEQEREAQAAAEAYLKKLINK